ncbi:uncharacterized protein CTRU02_214039 [Colletotrichum truncatum]|uniref:Uncharacterized protein n=1 Tax=Colletotrichum truncatum TaxID=5467 RepID=A0ACC3YHG3_COLTU|nr:uncharacterized protein CTRU02_06350 [Colletotrichum truncatum]KAF6792854.1 hypothetical protein CTRU02_06350 [Colletotrichum truncatum]
MSMPSTSSTGTLARGDRPIIPLERMSCDLPYPTTEHVIKEEPLDEAISQFKNVMSLSHPREKVFFLKRIVDKNPRFDILFQIGGGTQRPRFNDSDASSDTARTISDAGQNIFVVKEGPNIKLLQSVASAAYTADRPEANTRIMFALKTCGFISTRDCKGQLHVLKVAASGISFKPLGDSDRRGLLYNSKWIDRVKRIARILNINMGSFYDGCGRTATPEQVGRWAAGHVEKKLATHIVFVHLKKLGIQATNITIEELKRLRTCLAEQGYRPQYEIHLTRGPCGVPRRSGKCVPFVSRLGRLTGIRFKIWSWEKNVILDGLEPRKPRVYISKKEMLERFGHREVPLDNEVEQVEHEFEEDDWRDIVGEGDDDGGDQGTEESDNEGIDEDIPCGDGGDGQNSDNGTNLASGMVDVSTSSEQQPKAHQPGASKTIEKRLRLPDIIPKPLPPTPTTSVPSTQTRPVSVEP